MPGVPWQNAAEMPGRDGIAVDCVGDGAVHFIDQMGGNLVAIEIEIDPAFSRASLTATHMLTIEGAGCLQVTDRKGQMEAGIKLRCRHGL